MYSGIIYKYTSPSNKSYIGQTTDEIYRKKSHYNDSYNINSKSYNYIFHKAIRKYDFDSFSYEVLITIFKDSEQELTEELDRLEVYYIGKFDTYNHGYNCTIGGKSLRGKNHPCFGTNLSPEHCIKLHISRSRMVAQYSIDGDFIEYFNSIKDASENTGISESSISNTCTNKQKTGGGYQWKYISSDNDIPRLIAPVSETVYIGKRLKGKNNPRSKLVYQYDLDYNFIRTWGSLMDIERELGYDSGCVSRVCNGKKPFYGPVNKEKYIWSYKKLD